MVEDWQLQLWLGLRVVASQARGRLTVNKTVLERTAGLWRANLAETAPYPKTTAYRLHHSMVKWLTMCSELGSGCLVPSGEPLAVLAGWR